MTWGMFHIPVTDACISLLFASDSALCFSLERTRYAWTHPLCLNACAVLERIRCASVPSRTVGPAVLSAEGRIPSSTACHRAHVSAARGPCSVADRHGPAMHSLHCRGMRNFNERVVGFQTYPPAQNQHRSIQIDYRQTRSLRGITFRFSFQNRSVEMSAENLALQIQILSWIPINFHCRYRFRAQNELVL